MNVLQEQVYTEGGEREQRGRKALSLAEKEKGDPEEFCRERGGVRQEKVIAPRRLYVLDADSLARARVNVVLLAYYIHATILGNKIGFDSSL